MSHWFDPQTPRGGGILDVWVDPGTCDGMDVEAHTADRSPEGEDVSDETKLAAFREWSVSLPVGHFRISCVFPLSPEDAADCLELMELVKKQIGKCAGEPAAPADPPKGR